MKWGDEQILTKKKKNPSLFYLYLGKLQRKKEYYITLAVGIRYVVSYKERDQTSVCVLFSLYNHFVYILYMKYVWKSHVKLCLR